MAIRIAPYRADHVERQLAGILDLCPRVESVRTDYSSPRPNLKQPGSVYPARPIGVVEFEHGRSFILGLAQSKAMDQSNKLASFIKDPGAIEPIRAHLSLLSSANPIGAWALNPLSSVAECIVAADRPPQGLPAAAVDYLLDALDDLAEALPAIDHIDIRYAVTHSANHAQRFRPFYSFNAGGYEVASVEAAMWMILLRHSLGSPKTAEYYEMNEARIGHLARQLSVPRDTLILVAHVLPLFGANYQATSLRLR